MIHKAILPKASSNNSSNTSNQLFKAVMATAVLFGGYFAIKSSKKKADAKDQASTLQDDIFTQQASLIRNALETFPIRVQRIWDVAAQIRDWGKVVAAYSRLTGGRNIESDLRSKLSTFDYNKFMDILQRKGKEQAKPNSSVLNEPAKSTQIPIGTKVFLSWPHKSPTKTSIQSFLSYERFPWNPIVINRPTKLPEKPTQLGTAIGARLFTFKDSPESVMLIQVRTMNGQILWFRQRDLGKFL